MHSMIEEELALLRCARARHEHCPSTENEQLVAKHEAELGRLLDRLPRDKPVTISGEAPVEVS